MIVKFQVKDNRYIEIIKKFLDDKAMFDLRYYKSQEELDQFKSDIEKIRVYKYKTECRGDVRRNIQLKLQEMIQQTFNNYINFISVNSKWKTEHFSSEDISQQIVYILYSIEIKVVNLIMDKAFNNERIFYIDFIDKYIIL